MYFATGNNLVIIGDMARRSLRCVIDAQCERPELRTFTTLRPDHAMMQQRVEFVSAALTVMRAFFVAGRPKQAKPLGSLEQWSRTVRDALIWLGEPDPCLTIEQIRDDDPRREKDIAALHAWFERFDDDRRTTKDIVETALAKSEFTVGGAPPKYLNPELRDALANVTASGRVESQGVGNWLRSIKDRIIGGYTATQAGKVNGNQTWRVVRSVQTCEEPAEQELSVRKQSHHDQEILEQIKRLNPDFMNAA